MDWAGAKTPPVSAAKTEAMIQITCQVTQQGQKGSTIQASISDPQFCDLTTIPRSLSKTFE
jgi:hypothetical protein